MPGAVPTPLELHDVVSYLLDRRLMTMDTVVDGGVTVSDVSRLNRVYVVAVDRGPGLVIKVADDESSRASIAREAAVLQRLIAVDAGGSLHTRMPALVVYDEENGVLILEARRLARDLSWQHAGGRFSPALAREAGRTLALLHSVPVTAMRGLPPASDTRWVLHVEELEWDMVQSLSPAGLEIYRLIQGSDELRDALSELRGSWRDETVIHGDVRWANVLASPPPGSNRRTRVQLIDWETAGVGDPSFDIGAFFGEYLRVWLYSIPIVDSRDPGRLLHLAHAPLRRMRPAARAFWAAYVEQRGMSASALSPTLRRASRYAGASLVRAALEGTSASSELSAGDHYGLRLCRNILRRPDEAAAHLLGVSAPWSSG